MSINVLELWNFADPAESEQRFLDAMVGASEKDQLILKTQVARTYGLRKQFDRAREILEEIDQSIDPEVAVRYQLELGRTHSSAAHSSEDDSTQAKEIARQCFLSAAEQATKEGLDYLAIDALHMMTMVDEAPDEQIAWNKKAIAIMEKSTQEDAKKWEGSLRHNMGYALDLAGKYDEAIAQFEKSRQARIRANNPSGERVARWMIAKSLRNKGELNQALQLQLQLELDYQAAGESDTYVFEELEGLYRALGDSESADKYLKLSTKDA